MVFQILAANPEHARAIAEVHVGSWRTTYRGIVPDTALAALDLEDRTQQWLARLTDLRPGTCTFVVLADEGGLAGFATGGPVRSVELETDAELYAIYLQQWAQRKGIGRALLYEVTRYLSRAKFQSLGVWVLELNPSHFFYETLGAELVAEALVSREGAMLRKLGYRWQSLGILLDSLGRRGTAQV